MNEKTHVCKPREPVCCCHMLFDEPSCKCPIHGGGIINRCDCGRFVGPSFRGLQLDEAAPDSESAS